MKVFAVIPAYNEAGRIAAVVKETKKYVKAVVVVDDGSRDRTSEKAQAHGAEVLRNIVNMGKGAALRTGTRYAISKGAEIVVLLDGDGQHSPKDIPKMVEILKKKKLDLVFGSRALDSNMPFVKRTGNFAIYTASRILFGTKVKDTQSGFKVFWKKTVSKIMWRNNGYAMDSEVVVRAAQNRLKTEEIAIKTLYTDSYKGTSVMDGIKIVLTMIVWRIFGL